MREEAVEDGGCGGHITEKHPPVLRGSIRGDQRRPGFMPAHKYLEQIFGGGRSKFLHAEVLEYEEIDARELLHQITSRARGIGFGEVGDAIRTC